jgi:hypothetical protein
MPVWRHQIGSTTIRLTLRKTGNLSRGHLEILRKPSKGRNGSTFKMTTRLGIRNRHYA